MLGPGYYKNQISAIEKKKFSNPKVFSESHRFESHGSYIDVRNA